jgi:translocation protein SEC63
VRAPKASCGSAKLTLCSVALVVGGWVAVGLLSWKILNTKLDIKIYNPFEILGISSVRCFSPRLAAAPYPSPIPQSTSEKDIKSHYKKLSKKLYAACVSTRAAS